jgi:hypothetical protein
MPTPTYTPLATVTLGSSAASVTFSSIPATYRDLILVIVPIRASSNTTSLRLNGSSASEYSIVRMFGDSGGATSDLSSSTLFDIGNSATNYMSITQIMDYPATDKHKTILSRQGLGSTYTLALAGRWANTAAVTSVGVSSGANWDSGSTFSLYAVIS